MRLLNVLNETNVRLNEKMATLPRLSVSQRKGVVPSDSLNVNSMQASNFEKYKIVQPGHLVINRFNAYKGALGRAPFRGIVSPDYFTGEIDRSRSDDRYIEYFLRAKPTANLIERDMSGMGSGDPNSSAFSRFDVRSFLNLTIPVTDLQRQQRIADYLDRETAEIDAAVADLDRYLELLEKRKKTLAVKHIFPYGFPQNLLSASDYLALGYQSVQRIASFAKLRKKRNDDPNADYLSLLRGQGVIPYEEKGNVGNKKPQDLTTSFMVEKGDYLVNSMNFGIGSFGRSSYSGVASAAYLIFCINEELVNPDFLQFVFANDDLRAQAQNLGNGILEHRKSINWDRFRAIYVPMPQRGKQDAIVDVLSRETSKLQSLIAESTKLRDLLLKRRSVLITEVVTGRKQV